VVRLLELSDLEIRYKNGVLICDATTVYRKMRDIQFWEKGAFVVFLLDSKNRVISREVFSVGTLNMCLVHPHEVFRTAIARNANSVIVSHNHPSGDTTPSDEDRRITEQLVQKKYVANCAKPVFVFISRFEFYLKLVLNPKIAL
jgi:DNA repair protein RadC